METMTGCTQDDAMLALLLPQMNELSLNDDSEANGDVLKFTPRSGKKTAEELAADALAADMDEWITFDPRDSIEPLDAWLEKYPPSEVSREDGIGWISVLARNSYEDDPPDTRGLQIAWEEMKAGNMPISYENITHLALGYNVTVGKWLFHVDSGYKVDLLWRLVATNLVYGTLGNFACSAKVSPVNPAEERYRHVVCIYNRNFTNEAEVLALENEIRLSGIKRQMKYKPDVYTCCGVYVNNPWNLRPTIFTSSYDIRSRSSIVLNHQTNQTLTKFVDTKNAGLQL